MVRIMATESYVTCYRLAHTIITRFTWLRDVIETPSLLQNGIWIHPYFFLILAGLMSEIKQNSTY